MTHRVAADDETLPCTAPNRRIQIVDHLGRRPCRARGEGPSVAGERGAHLKTPAAEDVVRRVVVLDQLEAPRAQPRHVVDDLLPRLGNGGVEEGAVARESPAIRRILRRLQWTNPDPGPRSRL